MFSLGSPIGWDDSFEADMIKRAMFMQQIRLQTYNNGKYIQFLNVLENLALNLIVNKEVDWAIKKLKIEKMSESNSNVTQDDELLDQRNKVQELKKEIQQGMMETERVHRESEKVQLVYQRAISRKHTQKSEYDHQIIVDDMD